MKCKKEQPGTGLCDTFSRVKILPVILLLIAGCTKTVPETEQAETFPVYEGTDLGFTYSHDSTFFRMWSPEADSVLLHLYNTGHEDDLTETFVMSKSSSGTWTYTLRGDFANKYYTYQIRHQGIWLAEKPDLYAVATGVNGNRAMIVDLDETDPPGWNADRRPPLSQFEDAIIYEVHLRDISIHPSSGIKHGGKYLGLIEGGTTNEAGMATGLDHLKELGITHVHLLPSFDHRSIDETRLDSAQYNWGYDPVNYNVPEGSYATDPYDGRVRIREFKQMVQGLHANGIRVIMDVVYNHTSQTQESNFNQLVPDYFYRKREDGTFSDASACGNETASEKAMMRRYMIESVSYWVNEYHIDGFRFDLMGIHDIETMNLVADSLHKIDSTILIYGEGWMAGGSPLPPEDQALKHNMKQMPEIAAFSDDLRDGLKGSVFDHEDRGFASGKEGMAESVKFGIVASVQHPGVKYDLVNYSKEAWALEPHQTINYVSCHDNHTLYDKLIISNPDATEAEIAGMHRLANMVVLTSQGIPFLHAGVDFMRTKNEVENSYNSPDSINAINWDRKSEYEKHFNYYRDLIAMRKEHPVFRMSSAGQIRQHLTFLEVPDTSMVAYTLNGKAVGDSWSEVLIILNGGTQGKQFSLPEGNWRMISDGKTIEADGMQHITNADITIPGISGLIFARN